MCNITEFPNESSCDPCLKSCGKGCRSNETCNLCDDLKCYKCYDYSEFSCYDCKENYQVYKGFCVDECKTGQYLNEDNLKCKDCSYLCLACNSDIDCLNCTENSSLNNGICQCDLGYSGKFSCERNYFNVTISISLENQIKLFFSEPLKETLTYESINLTLNSLESDYHLKFLDSSEYEILLSTSDLQGDVNLKIEFLEIFTSIYNSLLSTKRLSALLFPQKSVTESEIVKSIKKNTSKGMVAASAVSASLSMMNFDIKSFFDFRNCAEIFSIIALLDVGINTPVTAFLSQIHESSAAPSFITSTVDLSLGAKLPIKFQNYGYKTNLLIVNSGMYFMTLAILISIYLPTKLIQVFKPNKLTSKAMNYLEFDAFLKLWIQGFLEISITSIIGILYTEFSNSIQIFDLVLCFFMLVIEI